MKILVVSEVYYPENFLINDLSQEWIKKGYEVEVVTAYPSYPQSYPFEGYKNEGYSTEEWNGVKIHRFPFVEGYKTSVKKKVQNYISFVIEGKKVAKRVAKPFDLIFIAQTGPLTVALPGIAAGKKYNIPIAIWTCDIWPDVVYSYGIPENFLTKLFLNRLIIYIYNNVDQIFISSEAFNDTIQRYTKKTLIYAPNWLTPTEEKQSSLRLDNTKFNFTFAGNISQYQNLPIVIEAFAKANISNAVLNIVGDGSYYNKIKKQIEENNIKNVILHGRYPYREINDILQQSDALILPLYPNSGVMKTEPLKLQSYLYAHKPIFGVLDGAVKHIIEDNELGVCANPTKVCDIANGFKETINFCNKQKNVTERSQHLLKTRFNKEKIVDTITLNLPQKKK